MPGDVLEMAQVLDWLLRFWTRTRKPVPGGSREEVVRAAPSRLGMDEMVLFLPCVFTEKIIRFNLNGQGLS